MTSLELCEAVENLLNEKKASDIVRIPLQDHSLIGDYFIVASGTSERQLSAIAQTLREKLKAQGKICLDGIGSGWVIADLGAIVVHLMLPQSRFLYRLEDLWQKDRPLSQAPLVFPSKGSIL
ncbi:MAG: ribosome silencing factor [Holosporales bacterium]|nr:ribosome silencing factor [Holosporales bacterium]